MGKLSEQSERLLEEKIIRLVNLIRDSDCEKSFGEISKYLHQYIKLFGKKYRIPGCDSDEIEQECLYALRYKAIEDFNHSRGKFKSFAILCIRRHLFSLIKANNQQKRTVLNTSLSLDEDRSGNGEQLSLASLITNDSTEGVDQLAKDEMDEIRETKLLTTLSKLEKEVYYLYLGQLHYDEIVVGLRKIFPGRQINKKAVDNALQRLRAKAQLLSKSLDWED